MTDEGDLNFVKMGLAFLRTSPARFGSFVRESNAENQNDLLLALSRDPGLVAALIQEGLKQPEGPSTILGAIARQEREQVRIEESETISKIRARDRAFDERRAAGAYDDDFMKKIAGSIDDG